VKNRIQIIDMNRNKIFLIFAAITPLEIDILDL